MYTKVLPALWFVTLLSACGDPGLGEPRESADGRLVARLLEVGWEGMPAGQLIRIRGRTRPLPDDFYWVEAKLEIRNPSSEPGRLPGAFVLGRREGQKAASVHAHLDEKGDEIELAEREFPPGEEVVLTLRSQMQDRARFTIFRPLVLRHDTQEDWRWPIPDPPTPEELFASAAGATDAPSFAGHIVSVAWTRMPAGTAVDTPNGPRTVSEDLVFLDLLLEVENLAEEPMDFDPPFALHDDGARLAPMGPDPNHHTPEEWIELTTGIGPGESRRLHCVTKGVDRAGLERAGALSVVHRLYDWRLALASPPPWDEIPNAGVSDAPR